MSLLDYLAQSLVTADGMRLDLEEPARCVAEDWVARGVDPALVEVCAEVLARWAEHLPAGEQVDATTLVAGLGWLQLPPPVLELLEAACTEPLNATGLAALAVHVVDIAERGALFIFVPELPALATRSDRSGDAARRVGAARHLRG